MKNLLLLTTLLVVSCMQVGTKVSLGDRPSSICPLPEEFFEGKKEHLRKVQGFVYFQDFPSEFPEESTPMEGVALILSSEGHRVQRSYVTKTDIDGYFYFGKIPHGNYLLETCLEGWNSMRLEVQLDNEGSVKDLKMGIWLG